MLQEVYGKDLLLDPHVMSVDALKDYNSCGTPFPLPTLVPLTGQRFVTWPVALFLTCVCCLMCLYRVDELPAWWTHLEYLLCVNTAGRQADVHHDPYQLPGLSYFCPSSL